MTETPEPGDEDFIATSPEKNWVGSIAGYFRDFLDTDFKKTRAPKRQISSRCSAPGSLDTSLSHAAGLIEIAACHA